MVLQIKYNPPYSISQWNREAFASDKYGRNFLGVPTQRRADFAFVQHILKSMDSVTGRCAILLPNGILNRYEEQEMRRHMVEHHFVECVINIGKGLFYKSPMEACILICRSKPQPGREGKMLFINAVQMVTKNGNESYLTDDDIQRIADAYRAFQSQEHFCSVRTEAEILQNDASLRVQKYVDTGVYNDAYDDVSTEDVLDEWEAAVAATHRAYDKLTAMLEG